MEAHRSTTSTIQARSCVRVEAPSTYHMMVKALRRSCHSGVLLTPMPTTILTRNLHAENLSSSTTKDHIRHAMSEANLFSTPPHAVDLFLYQPKSPAIAHLRRTSNRNAPSPSHAVPVTPLLPFWREKTCARSTCITFYFDMSIF